MGVARPWDRAGIETLWCTFRSLSAWGVPDLEPELFSEDCCWPILKGNGG